MKRILQALFLMIGLFVAPAAYCQVQCPTRLVNQSTSGWVSIPANSGTSFVPIAPYQFTTPTTCPPAQDPSQMWALQVNCTVLFNNTSASAASIMPVGMGFTAGLPIPSGGTGEIHWTDNIDVASGVYITGPFCTILSTQAGQAQGQVALDAIPILY